jgi:oxaloacetate decarboxylase alpha subunit
MTEIRIMDTTLRDAHQSLWATRMTTAMMLPIAERMDRIGFDGIELMAMIQFDVCVRFLKENPWERLRLMRQKITKTRLQGMIRSRTLTHFDIVADDLRMLWAERLVANGITNISMFDALADLDNIVPVLRHAKSLGAYTVGMLVYGHSPVHTDELYKAKAKELIAKAGVSAVKLKDPCGLLTPDRIRTIIPAIKSVIGNTPLELHSHCTTGLAPLVYLEAAKLGVDQVQCAIAPLGNGSSQPATQTTVRNLRNLGFEVNVDDRLIDEVGEHFSKIAKQEGKPTGVPLEYDAYHFEHQVPGGMISNFKSQLAQAGLSHKLDAIYRECAQIRKELGWPIMVTPFSQFVGTQAVLNVVQGERYKIVANEVKKYALGHYGKLLAPVDPDILDKIVENGSSDIPLEPLKLEPAVPAMRKRWPNASDEERLLRLAYAGNHVDEMLAAGPMQTEYHFRSENPIIHMLSEIAKRPRIGRVFLQTKDMTLDLSSDTRRQDA